MSPFSSITVVWDDITSITQARSRQAQQSLQAAFSKGVTAANHGPQTQDSVQQDASISYADTDIHVPRAGIDGSEDVPVDAVDVALSGRLLHADNENISEQVQVLVQDAINDSPVYGPDPQAIVYDDTGAADAVRPGANNAGGQAQNSYQDKTASATTKTRLIELTDYPERRRLGTAIDLQDIKSATTAFTDQQQVTEQTAILGDQGPYQIGPMGASNIGSQEGESVENLVTHSEATLAAPIADDKLMYAEGTGMFHGTFMDIHAAGLAGNYQNSAATQIAVDGNLSGGNGEAFNVMPQAQLNAQTQDTHSTVLVDPRSNVGRDNLAAAVNISATSASDSEQGQSSSQAAEVDGFGPAYNEAPQSQWNLQESVSTSSVDLLF